MPQKFKIGDYVKANPNDSNIQENGWENVAGKVIDYDSVLGDYTVKLDALTLNALSEDYIEECTLNYFIVDEKEFEEHLLLPAERRDTDADYAQAKARIKAIEDKLDQLGLIDHSEPDLNAREEEIEMPFEDYERNNKILSYRFSKSQLLAEQSEDDRSNAVSSAELLLTVALDYYDLDTPDEWTPDFIEDFALSHVPRKVIATTEEVERLGASLVLFLQWLYEEEETDCGRLLVKTMRKVIPEMVAAAQDESNWGMSKSIFGQAVSEGVDLSDQSQLDQFVNRLNGNLLHPGPTPASPPAAKVVGLDPFRRFGRNDRITVRDPQTGEVQEGVKFKHVEGRLRDGELEVVG